LPVRDVLRALVSSQFFNARNPGNDTFVSVVLEQLLGITVQENRGVLAAGKRMYDGETATVFGVRGSSQADLVRIVVEDERFEPYFLARQHQALVGIPAPRKELGLAARRLREDPGAFPAIVRDWISSERYEVEAGSLRPKNDRAFIRCLYADLLGREADYQEFRRCRNALLALSDTRPLRSVVVKLILDSGRAALPEVPAESAGQLVEELFLRFLCRLPTPEEAEVFVAELEQAGAPPATLARALLTHSEYQYY
jgi:hypothetical protein